MRNKEVDAVVENETNRVKEANVLSVGWWCAHEVCGRTAVSGRRGGVPVVYGRQKIQNNSSAAAARGTDT